MKSRIFHYLIYVTFLIGIPTDAMSLGYDTKENIDGMNIIRMSDGTVRKVMVK